MQLDLVAQTVGAFEMFGRTIEAFGLLFKYSPFWAPPVLLAAFWRAWFRYVRAKFIASQDYCLLEIRLPQETFKPPSAMQAVFDGLNLTGGESTFIDRIWLGKTRTWYSLEIASHEGQVHLYIWTRKAFKRHIERNFYAHYPGIEVTEVPDYTLNLDIRLDTHNWYTIDYELQKPDVLPLKTYIDYHLDQTQTKEEQKVDPMASLLEFAGSMKKGEHLWLQILARPHKPEDITWGSLINKEDITKQAQNYIMKLRNSPEETILYADGNVGKVLSQTQLDQIKAIQRTVMSGYSYDVGVRMLYVAEHEHFDGTTIPAMIRAFIPFNSPYLNQLMPNYGRWMMKFDYPWQDFNGIRENKNKIQSLRAYRMRSWFHAPFKFKHHIFTSEELATLFHLPGSVVSTPTVQRISSTRAEPPANLPT